MKSSALEFIRSSPRNIRRRLFRDILFVILITSGALLLVGYMQGVDLKKNISSKLIQESHQYIQSSFQDIIKPLENSLHLISYWNKQNLLDYSKPIEIRKYLSPLLEIHPELLNINITNVTGKNLDVSKIDTIDSKLTLQSPATAEELYVSATNADKNIDQIKWSKIYFHPKLQMKVLSAKLVLANQEGNKTGTASLTISLNSILQILDENYLPYNIEILILNKTGLAFSRFENKQHPTNGNTTTIKPSFYKNGRDKAVQLWLEKGPENTSNLQFQQDGISWWVGFTPLYTNNESNYLAVLLPESHFIDKVQVVWMRVGLVTLVVILFAITTSYLLVRKYRFQLKDLPLKTIKDETFIHDVKELTKAGESSNTEFKSTIRTNLQSLKKGKEIEISWLKAVCAFMNSDGGFLLLGVDDKGVIKGIDADDFANMDKALLHCKNLISSHIGAEFTRYIHIKSGHIDNVDIVIIECERVRRPVFLQIGKTEDFFIRSGPSSIKLSMSQLVNYLNER